MDENTLPQMGTLSDSDFKFGDSFEDLIPKELKEAAEKMMPQEEEEVQPTPQQHQAPTPAPVQQQDESQFNLSEIEALIGEKQAQAEEKVEKPFWEDDEEYQDLVKQLKRYGVDKEKISGLLSKVTERTVVDKGKLLGGLEDKLSKIEKEREEMAAQMERYKELERGLMFDQSEETMNKYGVPMEGALKDIASVLQREGINVPLNKIMAARNRTELVAALGDHEIEDKDINRIMSQWRNYKDLEVGYLAEKQEAAKNIKKQLAVNIAPETVRTILGNSLTDFMKSQEKYAYIKDAVSQGLDKNEEVAKIVAQAQGNFNKFLGALTSPAEHVRSQQWLGDFAKFLFNAAHTQNIESKYYTVAEENAKLKESAKKLLADYKKIAGAAKGITGVTGIAASSQGKKEEAFNLESVIEKYNKIKNDDDEIAKIIPFS